MVSAVEGGPARPRDRRRPTVEAGVRGAPTLVQNVETLAHVALIARHGPAWFRGQGTPDEPGTFVATIGGAVDHPRRVRAAARGEPERGAVGGRRRRSRRCRPCSSAGTTAPGCRRTPSCRCRGPPSPRTARVRAPACCWRCRPRPAGWSRAPGSRGYLADQSAGQCGPCRNGLPHLADTLGQLAQGARQPGLAEEVRRMTALVTGRGACHHPDGTARFVRSTLLAFAAELRAAPGRPVPGPGRPGRDREDQRCDCTSTGPRATPGVCVTS